MAESPAALAAYTQVSGILDEHSALTPEERQIAMLTVSAESGCDYCLAAHSTVARMMKMDEALVKTLREKGTPDDPKQAALVTMIRRLIEKRGWISEEEQNEFFQAGYSNRHLLDVDTILALKTLSNYTNHLAETPMDDAFKPQA